MPESVLDGVALALPALLRAVKIQRRAARIGFDWPDAEPVIEKVLEEIAELKAEIERDAGHAALQEELGDILFAVANLARKLDIEPEEGHCAIELEDLGPSPFEQLAAHEIQVVVQHALAQVPDVFRGAVILRDLEGLSYEEISDVMNCPIGTVRSRIFRAREAIAERLRPLLDTREGNRW